MGVAKEGIIECLQAKTIEMDRMVALYRSGSPTCRAAMDRCGLPHRSFTRQRRYMPPYGYFAADGTNCSNDPQYRIKCTHRFFAELTSPIAGVSITAAYGTTNGIDDDVAIQALASADVVDEFRRMGIAFSIQVVSPEHT